MTAHAEFTSGSLGSSYVDNRVTVEFVDSLVYAQDCMFPEASSALLFYHSSSSNL